MRRLIIFSLVLVGLQGNGKASSLLYISDSEPNVEYLESQDQPETHEDRPQEYAKVLYDQLTEIDTPEDLNQCLEGLPIGANETVYSESEGLCREVIGKIRDIEDLELLSQIYNRLYLLFYNEGDFDSATIAAEKSFSIAEEINFVDMLARGHQNFAILNSVRGRYVSATEHFLQSEEYYKELGDNTALAQVYGNMGVTFEQAGNLEEAYEYMHKELAMNRELGNEANMGYTMVNIGAVLNRMGIADSVLYYYEASLDIAERFDDEDLIITNLDNIGAYYSEQGAYETATSYLMSAYEKAENTGYEYQKIYIANNLAKNYLEEGIVDSAKKYAEIHLDLALDYDFLYDQQLAWLNLSEIYEASNEYEKAFEAHTNYAEVKDSLLNRDRIRQLEDLRENYEAEQRNQQIEMLTLQTETAEFRRNTYLVSGLLVTFILLLLYIGQRLKSRKNRQLFEKEQEVAEIKSNFFSNISHEFRTPLTLISGPIETMKAGTEDPKIRSQLDTMQQNAGRLLSLINQLMDLSRLESGKLELSPEKTDILTLVKGVTMNFQSVAEMKAIDLTVKTELTFLEFKVDREKLETILINLINNAFAYTPENGKIIVLVEVDKDDSDKTICRLGIEDTGQGISEVELPRVFDRFYRGETGENEKKIGTGIGLALTKELVELHNGSIEVFSKINEGTQFLVILPVENAKYHKVDPAQTEIAGLVAPEKIKPNEKEQPGELAELQHHKDSVPILLLIEDNEDVSRYLKDILGDTYRILVAPDGERGVESAFEHIPDLIISDVMMPKMDGYQVAETLKQDEKTSHIPLILLTAKASQKDKIQGLQTHADEYLTKPFRPEELQLRIQNLIESRIQLRKKYKREFMMRPDEISVHSMDEAFLLRVKKSVDKHIDDEHFTVEQLGKEVGMSRSQIHRKLVALTDQSATEFIRSYRLHRAKDMISQNAGSISEISYSVGFGSPSYFSKCFREEFGLTPSKLKESDS